jgi:aminoglycoside/choline kinase family phosphotransferase
MALDLDMAETERVSTWLARVTGRSTPFKLSPIRGGASPRRFYRVEYGGEVGSEFGGAGGAGGAGGREHSSERGDASGVAYRDETLGLDGHDRPEPDLHGGRQESAIVMLVPPETPDVAFAREHGRAWPFLEVRTLLAAAGVRVPALLAAACDEGLLLVEDLGPTLAEHLEGHPSARESLYRSAVSELARAQTALDPLPQDSVVRLRQFDAALYTSELEHFWDWAVAARSVDAPRPPFQRALSFLVEELCALPRGFTHRDYQSRNLLLPARRTATPNTPLGWIDFQDALLGPRAYDLVALLCDSYQPFERAFVDRRLEDYANARALSPSERRALAREFDLLTVQRKLKDAGRFIFIERRRHDPSFLPFVAPTLDIVASALERLSDAPALRDLAPIVAQARRACE